MISTKGRYALRVIIDISLNSKGDYISLGEISKREDISIKYLEQIIKMLVHDGLVVSQRGNNGGYRLAKKPSDITVYDVLKATEGSIAPVACLIDYENQCPRKNKCNTVSFWMELDSYIAKFLKNKTIADFTNSYDDYII